MTKRQIRQTFKVAHMTFETNIEAGGLITFGLYATVSLDSTKSKRPKPLYVGFVEKGMAAELLKLSAAVRKLENEVEDVA